jgi:DNA-binding FadR family transcriptional regulator
VSRPSPTRPAPEANGRRRVKLADRIYERILADLAAGRLEEGGRLPSEPELARAVGVSRPVVREALSRLRADGVIESRHGSGTYVRRRPSRELLNLAPIGSLADLMRGFEFRIALEGEAAYLAASRRSPEDLAALAGALEALDAVIARGEIGTEADVRFHNAVARASRNKLFEGAMESLAANIFQGMHVARRLSLKASLQRLELVQAEHRRIYEAIASEDPEAARLAMRTHIANARTRLLSESAEP